MSEFTENDLFWRHLNGTPPAPHLSGKIVVMGHTPQPGKVLDLGHALCIDTLCFGDGCLTALDVERGDLWQVDKSGQVWNSPSSA